ncbi:MAG: hypothetical protein HLUCCO03_13635 [Marinobacter sp. HL-58]|nr:MAG: hypothetical protein HLUCCO03_13635 [Marinobacter sp. HL-58]
MIRSTLSQESYKNPSNLIVVQCPDCHELSMISRLNLAAGEQVRCNHCKTFSPIEEYKGYPPAKSG